jgi:hypothetical protein
MEMTHDEMNQWILTELDNLKTKYNVKLNKIIYYRVMDRNHTLIVRDDEWFEKYFGVITKTWNYVLFLRDNREIAEKWKNFIESLKMKNNNKIMDYLEKLYNENNKLDDGEIKITFKTPK